MSSHGEHQAHAAGPVRGGRRRYLVVTALGVAGIVLAILAAAWVGTAPGRYVSEVNVVVHPPLTDTAGNPLATENTDAVRFAGLIAEVATNGEEVPRVTGQDLTLADQGMRHETLISLVNLGGQWANDFSRPFIRVEAVDATPEAVTKRIEDGVAQVNRAMEQLQQGAKVRPAARATTEVVPAAPTVRYEPTHRARAMLATFLLGLVITVQLCRSVSRRLGARRRPERGAAPAPAALPSSFITSRDPREGSPRARGSDVPRHNNSREPAGAVPGRMVPRDKE
jgi:hypothetical protein